jgi:hypothetical protein
MKSADEYAENARHAIYEGSGRWLNDDLPRAMALFAAAQAEATLALAAATLEAARLMGPTPEDQARLDALMPEAAPFKLDYVPCLHEWQGCPVGEFEDHVCDLVKDHTQARHHCVCGAISR